MDFSSAPELIEVMIAGLAFLREPPIPTFITLGIIATGIGLVRRMIFDDRSRP